MSVEVLPNRNRSGINLVIFLCVMVSRSCDLLKHTQAQICALRIAVLSCVIEQIDFPELRI